MAGRPETMRAAVYRGPRELAVEQRPVPELGERDVLLEVSHCGVCGTDLHLVLEGMGMPNSIGGHEYSGTIVARGPEVNGWELGTAVVGGGPEAADAARTAGAAAPRSAAAGRPGAGTSRAPLPSTCGCGTTSSCAFPRASRSARPP